MKNVFVFKSVFRGDPQFSLASTVKIGIMVTPVKKVPIHLQSAQNRLIIKNGTVVNHDGEEQVDIYIEVRQKQVSNIHLSCFYVNKTWGQ